MSAPLNRVGLRDRLAHCLEAPSPGRIVRVLPLGFPILETSADLRVAVSEPLGLVERRLLLAVQQFGPAGGERLDEILGIGTEIIDEILQRISTFEPLLRKAGSAWCLPAEVDIARVQQYSKEVVQRHGFVVNGLTGQLLPVDFWKRRPREQLKISKESPDAELVDSEKRSTAILWKLANRVQDAEQGIAAQLSADAIEKERLGIPALTREVLRTAAGKSNVFWLATFLFVLADGSIRLTDTKPSSLVLADKGLETPEYWGQALANAPGFERWHLSPEVRGERLRDALSRTLPTSGELQWDSAGGALRLFLPVDPEDAGRPSTEPLDGDIGFQWQGHLRNGWVWTTRTDELVPVLPGNATAAGLRAVLRGIRELRGLLKPFPPGHPDLRTFDLADWWRQWKASDPIEESWREAVEALPLDSFILRAGKVRDREFREKLEELTER